MCCINRNHKYAFLISSGGRGMKSHDLCIVKSFKHDGKLHRLWRKNWLLPCDLLLDEHRQQNIYVIINDKTPIEEGDGSEWVSRVPSVNFFIPDCWFNIVALIEATGIRYYCNIASPPYYCQNTLTYIDYDLDVILTHEGEFFVLDEDEYEEHIIKYRYSDHLQGKIEQGLTQLIERIKHKDSPFNPNHVKYYYTKWMEWNVK